MRYAASDQGARQRALILWVIGDVKGDVRELGSGISGGVRRNGDGGGRDARGIAEHSEGDTATKYEQTADRAYPARRPRLIGIRSGGRYPCSKSASTRSLAASISSIFSGCLPPASAKSG